MINMITCINHDIITQVKRNTVEDSIGTLSPSHLRLYFVCKCITGKVDNDVHCCGILHNEWCGRIEFYSDKSHRFICNAHIVHNMCSPSHLLLLYGIGI